MIDKYKSSLTIPFFVIAISLILIASIQLHNRKADSLFTDTDRSFYYQKAIEHLGGAGEFSKISPNPSSNKLELKFDYNYENITLNGDKIVVEDYVSYLNNLNNMERYKFKLTLSKDGTVKKGIITLIE